MGLTPAVLIADVTALCQLTISDHYIVQTNRFNILVVTSGINQESILPGDLMGQTLVIGNTVAVLFNAVVSTGETVVTRVVETRGLILGISVGVR